MKTFLYGVRAVPLWGAATRTGISLSADEPDEPTTLRRRLAAASEGRDLVVLVPHTAPERRDAVARAAASLDHDRVLVVDVSLPPVAAGCVAALAQALAEREHSAAQVAVAVPLLERMVASYAFLTSVSNLDHLPASLGQHAASWLPGGRFLAVAGEQPRVERLGRAEVADLPPGQGRQPVISLSTRAELRDVLQASWARAPRPEPVVVEQFREIPDWWGTDEVIEVAEAPTDIDAVINHLRSSVDARWTCRWCARRIPQPTCVHCGMLNSPPPPDLPQPSVP